MVRNGKRILAHSLSLHCSCLVHVEHSNLIPDIAHPLQHLDVLLWVLAF